MSDWRDRLLAKIDVSGKGMTMTNNRSAGTIMSSAEYSAVMKAARQRGISTAGYVRRAAVAMAAHDLGLELAELQKEEPAISPVGQKGEPTRYAGAGFGLWRITGLE